MTTKTITAYRITASIKNSGHRVDATDDATLGEHLGELWVSRDEAEAVAARLQREVRRYDLDPSTEYEVESWDCEVGEVELDAEAGEVNATVRMHVAQRQATWQVQLPATPDVAVSVAPGGLWRSGAGNSFDETLAATVLGMVAH